MFRNFTMLVFGVLVVSVFQGCSASYDGVVRNVTPNDTTRSLAPYFTPATSSPMAPDDEGFLQRWLLLEPINKPNRSNTVFTDSYIRKNLRYFILS